MVTVAGDDFAAGGSADTAEGYNGGGQSMQNEGVYSKVNGAEP